LNIEKVLKDPRLMSALTGVTIFEFNSILPDFEEEWIKKKKEENEKKCRIRKWGGGSKGFLKTPKEKLFFILFYYKCYPTYDLASVIFGCDRSQACRRQFDLTEVLENTLGRKLVLPERQMKKLEDFFKAFPEAKEVFIDGTERPIQRPKNKRRQKDNYSGKKKRHTRKNLLITTEDKYVGLLSETVNGKDHDFTILKQHAPPDCMPKDIKKHLDLGFIGFDKQFPGHTVSMPEKKPHGKELDPSIKEQNKQKSSVRVLVENSLAGVKRLRIVSDVFRGRKENFDDTVMLISCGLWNYHLMARC
jgi:hypothetical protein